MAQTPVTVMPCSLQSIAVVTDIIAKERYFQPEKKQKREGNVWKMLCHWTRVLKYDNRNCITIPREISNEKMCWDINKTVTCEEKKTSCSISKKKFDFNRMRCNSHEFICSKNRRHVSKFDGWIYQLSAKTKCNLRRTRRLKASICHSALMKTLWKND